MFGIGLQEILILVVIAVLVFGAPAVIGYFIGYEAGKRKASDAPSGPAPGGEETMHD